MKRKASLEEKLRSTANMEAEDSRDEQFEIPERPMKRHRPEFDETAAYYYEMGKQQQQTKEIANATRLLLEAQINQSNPNSNFVTLPVTKTQSQQQQQQHATEAPAPTNTQPHAPSLLASVGTRIMQLAITSVVLPAFLFACTQTTSNFSWRELLTRFAKFNGVVEGVEQRGAYVDMNGNPLTGNYSNVLYKKR